MTGIESDCRAAHRQVCNSDNADGSKSNFLAERCPLAREERELRESLFLSEISKDLSLSCFQVSDTVVFWSSCLARVLL